MTIDLSVTSVIVQPELNLVRLVVTPTFTSGLKEQLQSDWEQTDETAKDFIKNKPEIPTDVIESVTSTDNHIVVDNTDPKNPSLSFQLVDNENLLTDDQLELVESAVQPDDLPTFGDIVTHDADEFSTENHNHSLANLIERSYNSLTDLPNLSLLEDVIDINTWFDSIVDLQPPLYEGQVAYVVDEKYLLTALEEIIEETTQLNWYLLDFHWKIYVDKDADSDFYGKLFIYNGIELVVVPDSLVLGETSSTAFDGLRGKTGYDHSQTTGNPHGTTVSDLSDVDGAATTVSTGDSFFLKVGNLWKTITESNFLTWLGNTFQTKLTFSTDIEADKASTTKVSAIKYLYDFFGKLSTVNTWSLLQTFTSGLKTTKIIPNSDTTGVVIRNAADGADVVKVDTANNRVGLNTSGNLTDRFEVYGEGAYGSSINIKNGGGGGGGILKLSSTNNNIDARNWAWMINEISYGDLVFKNSSTSNNPATGAVRLHIDKDGKIALGRNNPETTLDVNGTTTLRDWVYLNSTGTRTTGDIIWDRRRKNILGVETVQHCTVANATKGSGTWVVANTEQLTALTDSNELIGAGSYIDLETSRSGRGSIIFGDGVGYADFIFTSAGVVTLIQYTSNVFTSVQTGTNHVIIKDNGTNVRIVNEMGSTMNFNVKIQYN